MGRNTKTGERKIRTEGKRKWKQFCRTSCFCLGPALSPPLFSKAWNSGKSYFCIMIRILPSKQFTSYTAYGKMFKYEILTSFYYKPRAYWEPWYPHKDGSPEFVSNIHFIAAILQWIGINNNVQYAIIIQQS